MGCTPYSWNVRPRLKRRHRINPTVSWQRPFTKCEHCSERAPTLGGEAALNPGTSVFLKYRGVLV